MQEFFEKKFKKNEFSPCIVQGDCGKSVKNQPLQQRPIFPSPLWGVSVPLELQQALENSLTGKAIDLNKLQGSLSLVPTHSLSGTAYSVAHTRYCAGLSILTTEKMPKVA